MSEDYINQLTLNFLISKSQLDKINKKKEKNNINNSRKMETELYDQRIRQLFNDLLVGKPSNILLQEVQKGFDLFIDKCIYYFKEVDNDEQCEKTRTDDYPTDDIIQDDIDYEKEEKSIEKGNYTEKEKEEEEDEEEEEEEDYTS